MPAKPSNTPEPRPAAADRRGYVRHDRALDTFWQLLGLAPRDLAGGRVVDLSAGGVGLVLELPFAAGASLVLRLPTKKRGWVSHLVRVKRCQPAEGGGFLIGCQFARPLTPDQLKAHLE